MNLQRKSGYKLGIKPHLPAVFLVMALILPAGVPAQDLAPQESVTIRSYSRQVVLDIVVTDAAGKPVGSLPQNAFSVLEDGVPQNITSFEPPDSQLSAAAVGKQRNNATSSAPAFTIIVLDELNSSVHDQAFGRVAIRKFLRKHGPRLRQPTSLLILGQQRLELLHDYTQDAAALVQALGQRHAELPFGLLTADLNGAGDRMAKTLWALQQIAAANKHFAGRKNVIWVGSGVPALNPVVSLTQEDRNKLAAAVSEDATLLLDARVVLYTVDPRGLAVAPSTYAGTFFTETSDELVFEGIAPDTGGEVFRLRNDVEVGISNSVDDGATYYTLAYYPTNRDWNNKFRNLQVALRGQGLRARARKGYFAVADAPLTDDQVNTVLSRAVMSPLPYRALRIGATAKGTAPGTAEFTVKVDRDSLSWQTLPNGDRRSEATVVIASVGASDLVYNHKVTELESVLDDKQFASDGNKMITFKVPSEIPPHIRHARIVVRDARSGNMGSADLPRESLPVQ